MKPTKKKPIGRKLNFGKDTESDSESFGDDRELGRVCKRNKNLDKLEKF